MSLFDYGKNLEVEFEGLINEAEEAMHEAYKASGQSVLELLNFDAKTGAAIGACVQVYKRSKKVALLQAKVMDQMVSDLKELKESNEMLYKQNRETQQALSDLKRSIEKMSAKAGD